MGADESKQIKHPVHQNYEQWKKQAHLGSCELVKNNQGIHGQLYNVAAKNLEFQLRIYQLRYQNPSHIVTVYHASQLKDKILCAVDERIQVITERIPYKLGDLGNIGYAQGLYIMQRILEAAKAINQKYLSRLMKEQNVYDVEYQENMVCFTDTGIAKLWINEDISLNNPKISFNSTNNTQKNLCLNLISLIQNKMSGNKFLKYIKQRLKVEQQGKMNTVQQCLFFINYMKCKQELASGEKLDSIVLPNMILNLGKKKKQSQQFKEQAQFQYTSNIRRKIQQAKMTNDFSKLQKPPLSRKSSRSKSGSKSSSRQKIKETQKPIILTNNKPNMIHEKQKDQINANLTPIIIINPGQTINPTINNQIIRKISSQHPKVNFQIRSSSELNPNPFKQIKQEGENQNGTNFIQLQKKISVSKQNLNSIEKQPCVEQNRKQLYMSSQSQKNILSSYPEKTELQASNLNLSYNPVNKYPVSVSFQQQETQMHTKNKMDFIPNSSISNPQFTKPAIITLNGNKVANYVPNNNYQREINRNQKQHSIFYPLPNLGASSPKVNFTFGKSSEDKNYHLEASDRQKYKKQLLRQSTVDKAEKQFGQKSN